MWSHYPMAIGNQKTIASKSPYLHRLVIGFAITWIYSGFVRVYLFPNLSKIIYFIPILLLFNISLSALKNINISSKNKFKFLSLFFLALVFQILHVAFGELDLIGLIYGLSIYVAPLSFLLTATVLCEYLKYQITKIILISVPINTALSILQTYTSNSRFTPKNDSVQIMTTFDGYARAFGTFSHPTGYAVYLSIAFGIILWNHKNFSAQVLRISISLLLFATLISGSRTSLAYNFFIILIYLLAGKKKLIVRARQISKTRLIIILASSTIIAYFGFRSTIQAFLSRIFEASQNENSGKRLLSTFDMVEIYRNFSLWGKGLGANSYGISSTKGSEWIESPYTANFIEGGVFLGLVFLAIRIFAIFFLGRKLRINRIDNLDFILSAAILPISIFGAIFGQATVAQGFWFSITLITNGSLTSNSCGLRCREFIEKNIYK